MKVYALPTQVPAPRVDYANYDRDKAAADECRHREAVRDHFKRLGYTGKNTGKRVSFSVADGSAEYLLIEGRTSFLIHLPYGDGYRYPDAQYLPKAAILQRVAHAERIAALFARKG